MNPAFWWTLTGVLLMISEFVVPGVILFFFGLGALITALLVKLIPGLTLDWQLGIFTLASLSSLFGLRRFLKPVFTGRTRAAGDAQTVNEGFAGEEAEVSRTITPEKPGKILLHGTEWKAKADETIEPGEHVEVVAQKSLTLTVKRK